MPHRCSMASGPQSPSQLWSPYSASPSQSQESPGRPRGSPRWRRSERGPVGNLKKGPGVAARSLTGLALAGAVPVAVRRQVGQVAEGVPPVAAVAEAEALDLTRVGQAELGGQLGLVQ